MSDVPPVADAAPSPGPAPDAPGVPFERDDRGFVIRGAQPTRVEAFVDAAFAFAVTLLVISVGNVFHSVDTLVNAMRGVPAFAASFAIIAVIWNEHRQWSQRFGLENGRTIRLSLALVFVVLLYVYPLRMMFTLAFGSLSGGVLAAHPVVLHGLGDVRALYVIFAVGYTVVALLVAELNRYALHRVVRPALSAHERVRTRIVIRVWLGISGVAIASLILALALPMAVNPALMAGIPGDVYVLIWPVVAFIGRRGRAELAALPHESA